MRVSQSVISKFRKTLSDMGLAIGLLYLFSRSLEAVSRGWIRLIAYHLVAQPVSEQSSLPERRGRTIDVREIRAEEAFDLPVSRPREVLEARFAQNARCLMASAKGRFLGFLWFVHGPYEEDEVRCLFVPEPANEVAWDFDVFVDPSARLGFAFLRLWDAANVRLSSQGVKWSISRISAFNLSSLASHRRMGLKTIATAAFFCAGPLQLLVATHRPYLHLALGRGSRPVMKLRVP